jgi:hypothetical protein
MRRTSSYILPLKASATLHPIGHQQTVTLVKSNKASGIAAKMKNLLVIKMSNKTCRKKITYFSVEEAVMSNPTSKHIPYLCHFCNRYHTTTSGRSHNRQKAYSERQWSWNRQNPKRRRK